jgi:putative transposase
MPRIARIVVPGYPHHVVQRGNRGLDVFFSEADYLAYIDFLRKACQKCSVQIWSYCLMTNHAHFIAVPQNADSLARCFADAHVRYTRMINKRENWKGHLWQARFGSSVLDEEYLIAAVRYVERNPVRAGMVSKPWEYRWSSARLHMDKTDNDPLVSGDKMLRELIIDWGKYLRQDDDPDAMVVLRREVLVSRPAGTETFIKLMEKRLGCTLLRQKAGRPMKKVN